MDPPYPRAIQQSIRPLDDESVYLEADEEQKTSSSSDESEEENDSSDGDEGDMDSDEAEEIYELARPILDSKDKGEIDDRRIEQAMNKIDEKKNEKKNKKSQMSRVRKFCFVIADSDVFSLVIGLIVTLNIVLIFLQTFESISVRASWVFTLIDQICLAIYIAEMAIKMIALRSEYFMETYNVFDFFIILISFIDYADAALPIVVSINASSLRAFRVFRAIKAFRMVRSVQFLRPLVHLLKSISDSLADCIASMILLLLIMYFYAFIGLTYYKEVSPANFGDFFRAFFSMFQLCTFDDWFDMYDSVKSINDGKNILFFITFMIICSFIVLNYVTAVLTDKACDAAVRVSNISTWMGKKIRKHRELNENLQASENTDQSSASQVQIRKEYENTSKARVHNISEILSLLGAIERNKMISDGHAAVLSELIDAALEYEQTI